jgi:hypothetical protein
MLGFGARGCGGETELASGRQFADLGGAEKAAFAAIEAA